MTPEEPAGGRSRQTQLIVLAVFAALLLIGGAIALSQSGGDDDDEPSVPAGDVQALIDSLRQNGNTIGDEDAPETVVEFADLQCPFCRQFAVKEIPQLLEGPVADGELQNHVPELGDPRDRTPRPPPRPPSRPASRTGCGTSSRPSTRSRARRTRAT